jgi:excisionase family DNA binding protein
LRLFRMTDRIQKVLHEDVMTAILDDAVAPTEQDTKLAQESSRRLSSLAKRDRMKIVVRAGDDQSSAIELPRAAVDLLVRILIEMAEGNAITLIPIHAELTTQQAASMLGVSRPFLIQQMEAKKIPFRKIGTHRRIRFKDVMDYKRRIDADRVKVLDQLAAEAQELKMGY